VQETVAYASPITLEDIEPLRIEVRDLILFELLKPAMARCEINIILKPDLVSIDEAFEGLERTL
jgi:hypothetical protein